MDSEQIEFNTLLYKLLNMAYKAGYGSALRGVETSAPQAFGYGFDWWLDHMQESD